MNKVEFVGRLAGEPKSFNTKYGGGCTFPLAVLRNRKDSNGNKSTDFFRMSAFGNTADYILKYAASSEFMGVVGVLRNNFHEVNGKRVYDNAIIVESVQFYGFKKPDSGSSSSTEPAVPPPDIKAPSDVNIMGAYSGDVDTLLEDVENMFANENKDNQ